MTEVMKPEIKQISPSELVKLDETKYHAQQKYDGMLVYAMVSEDHASLFSDRWVSKTKEYKHIADSLVGLPPCIIVGELYVPNTNNFAINSKENYSKARYCIFDVIQHLGQDVKGMPFEDRYRLLCDMVDKKYTADTIQQAPLDMPVELDGPFAHKWEVVLKNNWEGLVLKPVGSKYGVGWLKCKRLEEIKLEIKAYDPKENNSKGAFVLEGGNRCDALSSRFKEEFEVIKASGKTPIAELEYPFLTKDGKLFQPRLRRIYAKEDK